MRFDTVSLLLVAVLAGTVQATEIHVPADLQIDSCGNAGQSAPSSEPRKAPAASRSNRASEQHSTIQLPSISLTLAGAVGLPHTGTGIEVFGAWIAVSACGAGVQFVDQTDVTNPIIVTEYVTPNCAWGLSVTGALCYISESDSLIIIDVTDPSAPARLGSCFVPGNSVDVTVESDFAYVASDNEGLQIVDVRTPTTPSVVSAVPGNAQEAVVSGNYVFVAAADAGLRVVDITDAFTPVVVASFDSPGIARGLCIDGTTLYLADGAAGIQIIDVADPLIPTAIGGYDTPGLAFDVGVANGLAFVADYGYGVYAVECSNPELPEFAGSYDGLTSVREVEIRENYVYAVDGFGMAIFYLSGAVSGLNMWPEHMQHVVNHTPSLYWSYSDRLGQQQAFEIEIGTDSDWTVAEMALTGTIVSPDTQWAYTGEQMIDGATYYLRARAWDGTNWSYWSKADFRLNSVPPPPSVLAPLAFGESHSDRPALSAMIGADHESDRQQLQFAVFTHDSILLEESPMTPPTPTVAGDTVVWVSSLSLHEDDSYIWAARAFDGYEQSDYLDNFTVFYVNAVQEAPTQVALYDPQMNSIVFTGHTSFAWTPATDPDPNDTVQYDYRISIDSLFAFVLEVDSFTDTTYTTVAALEAGRYYWWKVLSRDNHGLTTESEVARFRTYKPGDVDGSWSVTSADIIGVVAYVFKGGSFTVPECAAKVNGDDVINSADIIYLVNYVFRGGAEPLGGCE